MSTKHFTVYLTSFRLDEGTYLIRIAELEARAKLARSEALYLYKKVEVIRRSIQSFNIPPQVTHGHLTVLRARGWGI